MGMPKGTYLWLIISVVWELFQGEVFGRGRGERKRSALGFNKRKGDLRLGLQAGLKIQITDSKEFVGVRCMVNML